MVPKFSSQHRRQSPRATPRQADGLNARKPHAAVSPAAAAQHSGYPPGPSDTDFCTSVSGITPYSKMKTCFLPRRSLWLSSKTSDRGEFVAVNKRFFHVICTFRFGSAGEGQRGGSPRDREGEESTYVPVAPESSYKLHNLNAPPAKRSFSRD